jgi:hypothetical protein
MIPARQRNQTQALPESNGVFLCFGGLLRLSGISRAAGGMPIPARARRRASFSILIPGFFLLIPVVARESRLAASALAAPAAALV